MMRKKPFAQNMPNIYNMTKLIKVKGREEGKVGEVDVEHEDDDSIVIE